MVNGTNETPCLLCGGLGTITGGFRYRESSSPQTRSCPPCGGDGSNHNSFESWFDWICSRIVEVEISISKGKTSVAGGMLRVAAEVAGFDRGTPMGRLAITSFSQQLEEHRNKRIESDLEAKELLSPTFFGAGMLHAHQLSDPNFDLDEFLTRVFGSKDLHVRESEDGDGEA